MKQTILTFLLFLLGFGNVLYATHNRSGEITYRHLGGNSFEITITTYTKASSTQADRCELDLAFGDGTTETVKRTNGFFDQNRGCNVGETIAGKDIKINKYVTTHTYAAPGWYTISMEDPNRNSGVINIPNSVSVPFYLESELLISPTLGSNSSPVLNYPPIDDGCILRRFEHNPGAVDLDISINNKSDSLHYSLVSCKGANGNAIPGYTSPDFWRNSAFPNEPNDIRIDAVTGTVEWVYPHLVGEYNIAILIEEYREIGGSYQKVGSVLRDLQVTVKTCDNYPPIIEEPGNHCIQAGATFNKVIRATDPDGDEVDLQATGEPFLVTSNRATFTPRSDFGTVQSLFNWNTNCDHIRINPYYTIFRASDFGSVSQSESLTDYETMYITVVAPAPEDLSASPRGSAMELNWQPTPCSNHVGYKIYRRIDSTGWTPSSCETGIPGYVGYQLIENLTDPNTTTYLDDNNGQGLSNGQKYCYLVYAYYEDGSESYASNESCGELKQEIPIITKVSVNATSTTAGSDSIVWSPPLDLSTTQWIGPYQYKLYHRSELNDWTLIYTSPEEADFLDLDTIFVDENINTETQQWEYRVEILSNHIRAVNTSVGFSRSASSVYLDALPRDNELRLSWDFDVPWSNNSYLIYKEKNGVFEFLDTAFTTSYSDVNLVNGKEYCYYVTSIGTYSSPGLPSPLLNNSQILCAVPEDSQPPCPVDLTLQSDCEYFQNFLAWTNPNITCDTTDDVVGYNIYYKPTLDSEYELLEYVSGAENTTMLYDGLESVAGCYFITAIDSFNNESDTGSISCVDNCPEYRLPNVFTPGGDGMNDYFVPFPYRYVESIDIHIYNRWGVEVFNTVDPDVLWDGRDMNSNEPCQSGVYFYTSTVNEVRLAGIVPRIIKGSVTILNQEQQFPNN